MNPKLQNLILGCMAATCCCLPSTASADERGWEYRPYRVRVLIALDALGGLSEQLQGELPQYLQQRVHAAIGPLWLLEVTLADAAQGREVWSTIAAPPDDVPPELAFDGDKLLLVSLQWTAEGYKLAAREYDYYVARWSSAIRSQCRQDEALPEHLFAVMWQAVAPLAQLELISDSEELVILKPRGAALMHDDDRTPWAKQGDVFLPIFRRTERTGEVIAGGIQPVPWTFVEVEQASMRDSDDRNVSARIHSANRRPFGLRRIGRIEQLAIALRSESAKTTLRLHSRTDPTKPLVGYEIYAQNDEDDGVTRIGLTDDEGRLLVPPSANRHVRILYIKNGGQLLARLPIVPGAAQQMDVPLPDDDPRLAAETRLAALREELIDVVARRNILMARARQKIEKKDFAAAKELLTAADQLPGRAQFNLTLTTAARTLRSDDPQIQRRIDQLIEATQTVMNQYLDVRPVNQLHDQLRAAQSSGG